jgi:predicted RNA-binding protein YlxR (DUF448 family)
MEDGTLAVGRDLPGRGAWLCRGSPGCLERAVKRHAFSRALPGEVGRAQLDRLASVLGFRPEEKEGPASGGAVL